MAPRSGSQGDKLHCNKTIELALHASTAGERRTGLQILLAEAPALPARLSPTALSDDATRHLRLVLL